MKTNILLVFIALLCVNLSAKAQKGNNQIQIGGQVGFPTGDLADAAKTGFGGFVKGMLGFGQTRIQSTLEAGYNYFKVKNLPSGVDANYSCIPIYTGFRYMLGNFTLEPQAGISINKVSASLAGTSNSDSHTNFAWATSVGYVFQSVELGVRYQSSEGHDSNPDLTFISIRLAYNF